MSEASHDETRIEDWVASESKKRAEGKMKKWILWGAIALGALAVIGGIIFFLTRGKKAPKTEEIPYLEGLDVECGPNGITALPGGGFLVTDIYGKKIWELLGKNAKVFAGAETARDASGRPMGGYQDANYEECLFAEPWAITPFLGGYAVSDTKNHVVRLLKDGVVETLNGFSDQLASDDMGVTFEAPTGLATDDQGRLYVADTERGIIYVITEQGEVDVFYEGLNNPMGICWSDGALYVAETGEHQILRIADGVKIVFAGNGEEGEEDGLTTTATFSCPQGVAAGKDGTIYVSDTVNGAVRRIAGGKVETIWKLKDDALDTFPVSPVGMCCENDVLYVCDPFSRRIYVLK